MLYLLRDYPRIKKELLNTEKPSESFRLICSNISDTVEKMKEEYEKRSTPYGDLEPYKAFFDYGYFSYMFARKTSDLGASKAAWSLYRSKFAYYLAEQFSII